MARKRLVYTLFLILIAVLAYFTVLLYRSDRLYDYVKNASRGWEGNIHVPDRDLGYKAIPESYGYHTFPNGENIPMRYNELGNRVPLDYNADQKPTSPTILFLGCSFTYGDACKAEETFPFLLGDSMNANIINAAKC
ncbi:MAG: hypothetical protein IIA45_09220, partial [Bacteroidetes bacterium]|nr:hypothetical protein [Bacteroidota bacterium]